MQEPDEGQGWARYLAPEEVGMRRQFDRARPLKTQSGFGCGDTAPLRLDRESYCRGGENRIKRYEGPPVK